MRDSIRKLLVPGLFCSVVAVVWALGAVKADLEGPTNYQIRVDPVIVRAAFMADPAVDASMFTEGADLPAAAYLFAS